MFEVLVVYNGAHNIKRPRDWDLGGASGRSEWGRTKQSDGLYRVKRRLAPD